MFGAIMSVACISDEYLKDGLNNHESLFFLC